MATANDEIIRRVNAGLMTNDQAQALLRQAGVNVTPGEGRVSAYLSGNSAADQAVWNLLGGGGAAMPANIEPLHQYEKTGLQTFGNREALGGGGMTAGMDALKGVLANPSSAQNLNPQAYGMLNRAGGYYDKAAGAADAGMSPITESEIMALMNPYEDNVVKYAGDKARAAINAQLGSRGGASFGDTISGQRLAALDELPFQYRYQGWKDATGLATDAKNRSLTGAGIYGNLGTAATNTAAGYGGAMKDAISLPSTLFDMGRIQTDTNVNAVNRQIGAGQAIRDYNQGINDQMQEGYIGDQTWTRQNIAQLLSLMDVFGGSSGGLVEPDSASKIGSIAGSVGGVAQALGGFL